MKTKFKIIGPKGTITTARFADFHDDPEKGRALADRYIQQQLERWWSQPMFASENLQIVED